MSDESAVRTTRALAAPLRLVAVHAHPDDESSKGAASLAKYAAEGAGVWVVTVTGGERGDILNPKYQPTDEPLTQVRRAEMARAAEILGVEHRWLGFVDSGYHKGSPETWQLPEGCFAAVDIAAPILELVKVLREVRPQVLITYDEEGGYPHADHIRTHDISVAAFDAAADPAYHPEAGAPWQISKLYYLGGFSRDRLAAIDAGMRAYDGTAPYEEWIARMDSSGRPDRSGLVTTRVPVAEYFPQRDAALLAHETQIDPDSRWFIVPRDIEAAAWGTDDYELVKSLVETTVPEDDLFAGLRETVAAVPVAAVKQA